jgi:hypothetical protein
MKIGEAAKELSKLGRVERNKWWIQVTTSPFGVTLFHDAGETRHMVVCIGGPSDLSAGLRFLRENRHMAPSASLCSSQSNLRRQFDTAGRIIVDRQPATSLPLP